MGKRRNQRKNYVSGVEHAAGVVANKGFKTPNFQRIRRMPYDRCALSMTPYETPMCSPDGLVFDLVNIVPYVAEHKRNPVTGAPLLTKDLIRLHMKRNAAGRWCCPVGYKEFTENSHIVAVRPSGNVYSWEALNDLCLKPKHLEDLISGQPFTLADIITIQDPNAVFIKDVNRVAEARQSQLEQQAAEKEGQGGSIQLSSTMKRILAQVPGASASSSPPAAAAAPSTGTPQQQQQQGAPARGLFAKKTYGASFTSTAMTPVTSSERAELTEEQLREQRYRHMRSDPATQKSYVRLKTSLGDLNLELHTDLVPKTCHNFLLLCQRGYYDNLSFHRLVPGFMVQGGDPSGTGRGGQSAWGSAFGDEFHSALRHDSRGVLSMANAGPGTNNSQFFITFAACPHLDNKHSVFGRVAGGSAVLDTIEQVPRVRPAPGHEKILPSPQIRILGAEIFYNAFDEPWEAKDELELIREKDREKERLRKLGVGLALEDEDKEAETPDDGSSWLDPPKPAITAGPEVVGKYLQLPVSEENSKKDKKRKKRKQQHSDDEDLMPPPPLPVAKKPAVSSGGGFGNFDGW